MANRFKVGDLEVLAVSDGMGAAPGTLYFRGTTDEMWEKHKQWLNAAGMVEFPFSCFLVQAGDKKVLIDTGLGQFDMFGFRGGALFDELAAGGVQPEDVDIVLITHLHVDHAGNIAAPENGGWRPLFPNATLRWTTAENDYWADPDPRSRSPSFDCGSMIQAMADRFEPADDGASIAEGINVIATPGHTPGHGGIVLSSQGKRAFILGDAISCPVQLTETEWSGLGDLDPALARASQEAVIKEMESDGEVLLTAAHFPGLTLGRVIMAEGKRYWEPV
ncbi:MAG TPA: MBL fold metallo-hydrolase [Dehalococcoidia bacterium]|nr:MBL fold metallo-hydrolase [Dehalococcoidia bacterium]